VKFLLVSDVQRRVIRQFGVLHPTEGMARPAVFIIDKKGVVRFLYVGRDYTDRPPIESILQALAWL